ncbi:MAG: hydrogenase 4 subunit B [Alphaproteobacteria bacterium]|nr:hydrogenase 4 subunit B [Alphaproteobacteria bacterium]
MTADLLVAAAALLVLGFAGALWPRPDGAQIVVYGGSAIAAAALAGQALLALLGGGAATPVLTLPLGLPWVQAHFRLDALSLFFVLLLNLAAALVSLYALGYGRHEEAPHRVLPFYPVYLAAMNLVLAAADAFSFLVSWECMSVASWLLVLAQHREAANRHAAFVYLAMAGFGTMALLFAFGLLAGAQGDYSFAGMRTHDLTPVLAGAAIVLALIGAGSKAGLVPLHVWLPLAHPAAPSHVSALMSGVMTKVAIYGLVRIVFDLAGPPQWWWGALIMTVGAVTAVLGILHALLERDIKTLLAYSTIKNVGVIAIGLGLALVFRASGIGDFAALPFIAALFHALNHSLFKSLLFCAAGAVAHATGTRDIERLGGLIHRMPRTAFVALVGCFAIAGLPPLNGFVSEWLMLQSVFTSPSLPQPLLKLIVPVAGVMLVLAAALAAACFVRLYGIVFLGRPRSPDAAAAGETDAVMIWSMAAFAALCLVCGALPAPAIGLIEPAARAMVGAGLPDGGAGWLYLAPVAGKPSSYSGAVVLLAMIGFGLAVALLVHRLGWRSLRRAPPWDCGFPSTDPTTQYSGSSFAQPLRRVFGTVAFRAAETVDMPDPGETRPARFALSLWDPAWRFVFNPCARFVVWAAEHLNALQFMTIRRHLSFMFATLIALLLAVAAVAR